MTRSFIYYASIFLSFFFSFPQFAQGMNKITGVRFWSSPEQTRIALVINAKFLYKYFTLTNPHRFVVDCKDTITSFPHNNISVNDAVVSQIRFGRFKKDVLRIVFDLVQPAEEKLFFLEKSPNKPSCLVVELSLPNSKYRKTESQTKKNNSFCHRRIIVIDPGHGGEDPGAIGPGGTMEKDIVLRFARYLKKVFDEKQKYQAFLTRNGDYFLPLRERVKIAEDYCADLFISIHADSNRSKRTRGSSVYCLSLKGASDEAAHCLAEKENASDLLGGIPFTENDDLNFTLLDLALTNNINSSLHIGGLVLREIKKVHPVKFEKPKQAGFRVLKTAEIPSILIELGFISNPSEEKLLKQKKFQAKIAKAVFSASDQFLEFMARKEPLKRYPLTVKTSGGLNSIPH